MSPAILILFGIACLWLVFTGRASAMMQAIIGPKPAPVPAG